MGDAKDKIPIRKSRGSYQKVIVSDYRNGDNVAKNDYDGYYFFEIKVGTKVKFHLHVLKASNMEATAQNVYWVAQKYQDFKTKEWLDFRNTDNKLALHELLNELNKGSIYGEEFIEGEPNPDYHVYYPATTEFVGKQYLATNPFVDKLQKKEIISGKTYGNFTYETNKIGTGIWLEGINYRPDWKSQGAFIIAVDEPQIVSLWAEKRTLPESQVRAQKLTEADTDHVFETLLYGDYIDLHVNLHNVLNYSAHLEIYCGDTSIASHKGAESYYRIIPLEKHFDNENPSLNYNLKFYEELLVDLRWAEQSDHEEGEDDEDSLQEYKMVLVLTPHKSKKEYQKLLFDRKTLKREITFTVNYKNDFSDDVHEPEYVEQIAYINQPPLVSQSFEDCNYSKLEIIIDKEKPVLVLQENQDGSLTDNKTPFYSFVADTKKELIVNASSDVASCIDEASHINNVFDISQLDFPAVNSVLFAYTKPIVVAEPPSEKKLKLKISYPYQADNDIELFTKYIFGGDPLTLWIPVQSCRYKRTLAIKIYPGIEWVLELSVGSLKPEVYSYTNMKDSSRTPVHNARARTAAINKESKSQEVIFEVKLDAKYHGKTNPIISTSYENKIKKVLEAIVFIKDTMDNLTGVTKAKKGMAAKLGGELLKSPFTFQLDFPVISIKGAWNYGYMGAGVVKRQGSITFGFTPLIKGTGKIDLITASEFFPVVGQIIKAADLVLLVAGVEIYFNLYAYGEITLQGTIEFNKEDNFSLDSATTLGIGAELGVKAEASTKKLTFKAEKTREEKVVGFELAVKGETSLTISGSAGHTKKGPYIELDVGFNGIIVYVTARAQAWGGAIGPKDKPYLLVKPKSDIYKDRWYLTSDK